MTLIEVLKEGGFERSNITVGKELRKWSRNWKGIGLMGDRLGDVVNSMQAASGEKDDC